MHGATESNHIRQVPYLSVGKVGVVIVVVWPVLSSNFEGPLGRSLISISGGILVFSFESGAIVFLLSVLGLSNTKITEKNSTQHSVTCFIN